MCDFIDEHHDDPVEYYDKLTRKLVEKVTIGDYSLEVTFKCGIKVGI
ncbi:MAG: hypothetical protein VB031_09435 [Eubacteriaceae bacterium]|nr:hypothetical protein [Eubacteriaceae bacterium]